MAYTALYRKFRPLKFSDMVGEDAIIVTKLTPEELNTFKNAVEPVREKFINKYGKENYNAFINK